LLACRTRETLQWHFRRSLSAGNAWILTASIRGRLAGYAVFDRSDHAEIGLKRVRLVDYQAAAGCESVARPVLAYMLRKCREDGIHVLENVGCWFDRLRARSGSRPYRRSLKSWSFYFRACDANFFKRLLDRNAWAPTAYDGDSSV
jgi:hypothetical protein